ncbi:MAG TPA: methyltransferase domain-containing protein [Bryobacteraceae bacterium]|nr:methyltransferase domain-containing protein [Bryobacteraceae bacterium]
MAELYQTAKIDGQHELPFGDRRGRLGSVTEAPLSNAGQPEIIVPADVFQTAVQSIGSFFEPISKIDRITSTRDFLDLSKAFKRAAILERYTLLKGAKVLEVGSGFGTNLAVWLRYFQVDGYGVEPGGEGFNQAYQASRRLLAANAMDAERVINSKGESLPFPDNSFDIVYSANVLEHTEDPERVLMEAIRVLRPGGLLHMEMPNYLSYFEGHYMVFQPPILWKPMLGSWVRLVFGRDPAFAATLHTRINPIWCRRMIAMAGKTYPLELISVGEDLFCDRLAQPFIFETQGVASRIGKAVGLFFKLNVGNWMGRLIVLLQGHYPIYLTVRKG